MKEGPQGFESQKLLKREAVKALWGTVDSVRSGYYSTRDLLVIDQGSKGARLLPFSGDVPPEMIFVIMREFENRLGVDFDHEYPSETREVSYHSQGERRRFPTKEDNLVLVREKIPERVNGGKGSTVITWSIETLKPMGCLGVSLAKLSQIKERLIGQFDRRIAESIHREVFPW
jgi:hypothetical protein